MIVCSVTLHPATDSCFVFVVHPHAQKATLGIGAARSYHRAGDSPVDRDACSATAPTGASCLRQRQMPDVDEAQLTQQPVAHRRSAISRRPTSPANVASLAITPDSLYHEPIGYGQDRYDVAVEVWPIVLEPSQLGQGRIGTKACGL